MKDSALRLEMPVFPEDRFLSAVKEVVKANAAYVPPYGKQKRLTNYLQKYRGGITGNTVIEMYAQGRENVSAEHGNRRKFNRLRAL